GDAQFQKKCLGKMSEVAGEGRTVLFVSHNMAAVQSLCSSAAVLNRGRVDFLGVTREAVAHYLQSSDSNVGGEVDLSSHPNRKAGYTPMLQTLRLLSSDGRVSDHFCSGETMIIEVVLDPQAKCETAKFAIDYDDSYGIRLFGLLSNVLIEDLISPDGIRSVFCRIEEVPLAPGRYHLTLSAGPRYGRYADRIDYALAFDVYPGDYFGSGKMVTASAQGSM